jgi:hypothetical protein
MAASTTVGTTWGLEYTIVECPKRHSREVRAVFPGLDPEGLFVIPTCQRSDIDLVRFGDVIEQEKDRLLERFCEFAKAACDSLAADGYWADYIDPCSGLPMVHKDSTVPYGEVEGFSTLLGYKTSNAGCCKILLHPRWGSYIYPASIFAKAPLETIQLALSVASDAMAAEDHGGRKTVAAS